MVNTTLARYLRNKVGYAVCPVLLTFPLANFLNAELRFGFFVLVAVFALFWKMVLEDADHGTIDIRCIALLTGGLFLCSHQSAPVYLFAFIVYLILFRMLYVASSLWEMGIQACCQWRFRNEDVHSVANTAKSFPNGRVPFLPCFAGGLLVLALIVTFLSDGAAPLWRFDDALDACMILLSGKQKMIILTVMLLALGIFEYVYWLAKKRRQPIICIGMGDVFVLPSFAAFLGGGFFLMTLGCALLLSLGFVLYQTYHRQDQEVL